MRFLLFYAFYTLAGILPGFAQSSLHVDLIADSLTEGSNAVLRYYKTSYDRESLKSYDLQVHYAITVMNARGKHAANLLVQYDRNSEVSDIRGTIYNKEGNELGKLKKKDLKDYPYNASYTLFSDNRVKAVSPAINTYPFTVEYSYTVHHNATVGFGNWMPLLWFNVATEQAELQVRTPSDLGIRYKAMNHPFEFNADTSGEVYSYKWTAYNLKAIGREPSLPHYLDYMPVVMLAPNDILYEETEGSYLNWEAYGRWVYSLIEERDQLPLETVSRMRELVDTIPGQREKVKAIYQYMQSRTRYVNVALGLGGFQPLHAYEVDEKGYGDCKALSNYTRVLLKSVGIASYYTEIGSGRSRELKYPDFASVNQTNHVILCVPLEGDTVWLECTSQSIPFGYIGTSNSDRYALLIGEEGGVLARTPPYPSSGNLRVAKSQVEIEESGAARMNLCTDFTQAEYEDVAGLLELSQKEQRESLLDHMVLEGFVLEDFAIEETSTNMPQARISMKGSVSKFATKSGKRLFLRPQHLFNQTSFQYIPKDREIDIFRPVGYHHVDTVFISLPEDYRVERLPDDVLAESDFGSYTLSVAKTDKGIQITRSLEILSGNYSRSQFTALNTFYEAISRSDQKSIIISQP